MLGSNVPAANLGFAPLPSLGGGSCPERECSWVCSAVSVHLRRLLRAPQ